MSLSVGTTVGKVVLGESVDSTVGETDGISLNLSSVGADVV